MLQEIWKYNINCLDIWMHQKIIVLRKEKKLNLNGWPVIIRKPKMQIQTTSAVPPLSKPNLDLKTLLAKFISDKIVTLSLSFPKTYHMLELELCNSL